MTRGGPSALSLPAVAGDPDAMQPPAVEPAHGQVQSVLTALDMLECFAEQEELGVTELARRLGVAKSTAHRLLSSLCSRGFVERLPESGHYRLGLHLYELGQLAQDRLPTRHSALPVLEELRINSGQTVHLSTADGPDVVFLERLQTLHGIPLLGERHRRMPLHSTSAGKVLAAYDEQVAAARTAAGFPRLTDRTLDTPERWAAVLAETRRQGYAYSDSENRIGLASIAAPIRGVDGTVTYAVSVAGPTDVIAPRVDALARLVVVTAARISRRLSHLPT